MSLKEMNDYFKRLTERDEAYMKAVRARVAKLLREAKP